MIVYSAESLLALRRNDVTISRAVRKTIFSLRLWRPMKQRRHAQRQVSRERCLSTNRGVHNQLIIGCMNAQSVTRKSALVCRTIEEEKTDLLVITETWHESSGAASLRNATPDGYNCLDAARPLHPGTDTNTLSLRNYGGIAVIHRREIDLKSRVWTTLPRLRLKTSVVLRPFQVNVSCYSVSIDRVVKQSARYFLMK